MGRNGVLYPSPQRGEGRGEGTQAMEISSSNA